MNIIEPIKLAVNSLLSNKLRTFLTTLGVIIGVAAVITLVSMGEGAKSYVVSQISSWGVGANSVTIQPGEEGFGIPNLTLTDADAESLRKIPHIKYIVPEIVARATTKFGKKEYSTPNGIGLSADYPFAVAHKVADGRFFSKTEVDGYKKVSVIGKKIALFFFGQGSSIGETIRINGVPFTIIGVFEEKGSMLSFDMDDMIAIPISSAKLLFGTSKLWEIFIVFDDEKNLDQVISEATEILTSRHHGLKDFHFHTQQGILDIINNILNALTGIVGSIAAISLLVGGIGIMNMMLVTVAERTREIGIRKAIGAKNRDIFYQFLIESIFISLSGTLLGIILGTGAAFGIMTVLKLESVIAYWAGTFACLSAILIGGFFGVCPAMRAARLDPVEALRRGL